MSLRIIKICLAAGIFILACTACLLAWLLFTQQGLRALAGTAERLGGPVALHIDGVSGRLCGAFRISSMDLVTPAVDIHMEDLRLEWRPDRLLYRELFVEHLSARQVSVSLPETKDEADNSTSPVPVDMQGILNLPIDIMVKDARVKKLAFSHGQACDSQMKLSDMAACFSIKDGRLDIDKLEMDAPAQGVSACLHGSMDSAGPGVPINLVLDARYLNGKPSAIDASIEADGTLEQAGVRIRLAGAVNGSVNATMASLMTGRPLWDADFRIATANAISMPDLPVTAVKVVGKGRGGMDKFSIDLSGSVNSTEVNIQSFALSGLFEKQVFHVHRLDMGLLNGQLSSRGWVMAGPVVPAWDLEMVMEHLAPSVKWPAWKGDLSGRLGCKGKWGKNREVSLDLKEIHGTLNHEKVHASGKAGIHNGTYMVHGLELGIGDTAISISGTLSGKKLDAMASINSPDISVFYPGAAGKLDLNVLAKGSMDRPDISLDGQAEKIQAESVSIGRLLINARAEPSASGKLHADVSVNSLKAGCHEIGNLKLDINGTARHNILNASVSGPVFKAALSASGAIKGFREYSGTLNMLQVSVLAERWRQLVSSQFLVSAEKSMLKGLCMVQPGTDSRICMDVFRRGSAARASLKLKDVSLDNISSMLGQNSRILGNLSGHADFNIKGQPSRLRGQVLLKTGPGTEIFWHGRDGEQRIGLSAELSGNVGANGAEAELRAVLKDTGKINARFILPGFDRLGPPDQGQPLNGRLRMAIDSLAFLDPFMPEGALLEGRFLADVRVAGTVRTPVVQGSARGSNLAVELPLLDVMFTSPELKIWSSDNSIMYSGTVISGNGQLQVSGRSLVHPAGWQSSIKVKGEDFRVAGSPEYKVDISPDITAEIGPENQVITGVIEVPMAEIKPRGFDKGAVTPSPDLVIKDHGHEERQRSSNLDADIKVVLGDNVKFEGFGLMAKLKGNLRIKEKDGSTPLGYGTLYVEDGTFTAIGKDLELRRGRLLFSATPVDNPDVDIEAVREADDVIAGFRIKGRLKSMELTLFSQPPLPQSEILSYILGGSGKNGSKTGAAIAGTANILASKVKDIFGIEDVDVENGHEPEDLSILIGKYLTPDLYVQFINDIGENTTSLKAKYRFSKHIEIQSETGDNPSADIFFKFER